MTSDPLSQLVATARRIAAEKDAELERLREQRDRLADVAENLVIAIGMGWDLEGVIEAVQVELDKARPDDA